MVILPGSQAVFAGKTEEDRIALVEMLHHPDRQTVATYHVVVQVKLCLNPLALQVHLCMCSPIDSQIRKQQGDVGLCRFRRKAIHIDLATLIVGL